MTPHQQAAHNAVQRIVGMLHHRDPDMKEADIAKLVSEAVYGYFDDKRKWQAEKDQDHPKEE